jgi:polar amino acid transport system substrate-binding protein
MTRKHCMMFSIAVFSILLLTSSPAISENLLSFATLEWEPYIGENLPSQGYVAEVVRLAYEKSGYGVNYKFMPWARVVKMTKEGKFDGYLPEYYADELKESFLVSDPFPGGPLGLFKRKNETIEYKTIQDLKPYRIGVVRGYVNTKEFDEANYLKKEEANDDLTNFKLLLKKRIDLVVADKLVGGYLISKELPENKDDIEFISPPLEVKNLYLCISKKVPDAEKKLEMFNKGLKELEKEGTLNLIMKQHGF